MYQLLIVVANDLCSSLLVPLDTPTKYVGGDRAGLESYLIERKRRKEEREAEQEDRAKEDKKRKDKKEKDRKMKPDKNAEKKVGIAESLNLGIEL